MDLRARARARPQAREEAAAIGREGGSLLGSLAEAAKAGVGAMTGPLEREGAFDESAAVVTGEGRGTYLFHSGARDCMGLAKRRATFGARAPPARNPSPRGGCCPPAVRPGSTLLERGAALSGASAK